VTLLGLLWRKMRTVGDVQLPAEAVHQRIAETYGFCVNDYRPDCWYYEPLDMLRKLALTGLLQFVNRGTATQVFCGCGLAFVMSGLQLRLQPYSEIEANILKTLVDAQLFLTFLLSFLLRVLPRLQLQEYEPLSAEFYGWMLLLSVIGLFRCSGRWAAGSDQSIDLKVQHYTLNVAQSNPDSRKKRSTVPSCSSAPPGSCQDDAFVCLLK
jgi:hypothetical protein